MIKNLHLLGAITILGLAIAAIFLQLVFKEGTNSTGLVKLSNDSDTANRRLQAVPTSSVASASNRVIGNWAIWVMPPAE